MLPSHYRAAVTSELLPNDLQPSTARDASGHRQRFARVDGIHGHVMTPHTCQVLLHNCVHKRTVDVALLLIHSMFELLSTSVQFLSARVQFSLQVTDVCVLGL